MADREYSGFVARIDDYGYAKGVEPVVFMESEVIGLSVMDGAGFDKPMYFACLKDFMQVQVQKSVFSRLADAGRTVASHA